MNFAGIASMPVKLLKALAWRGAFEDCQSRLSSSLNSSNILLVEELLLRVVTGKQYTEE